LKEVGGGGEWRKELAKSGRESCGYIVEKEVVGGALKFVPGLTRQICRFL